MTSLSIEAAARECPSRLAIIGDGFEVTYAQLAARVRSTAPVSEVVGHIDVDTIVRILAAFEAGIPLYMIHPRWTASERAEVRDRRERPVPAGTLAVFATSGSSGKPKLVALSRHAFLAAASASEKNLGFVDDDRWQLSIPLAHVGGFSILVRTLCARRTVVLGTEVGAHEATIVSLVPTQLARLLDTDFLPHGLRVMLIGGASVPEKLLRDATERVWPIYLTYGSTETCAQVATTRRKTIPSPQTGVGPPLDGVEIRIVNDEILVSGESVAPTYLCGTPSPVDADGWLHTGDLGRVDEAGRLHVWGRRDGLVISGGENVMPFEVEEALCRLPGVRAATVFGVDDDEWGEIVAAAIVADSIPDVADFDLADYKRPRRLALVERFPTTRSGKIDRLATKAEVIERLRSW